MLVTIKILIVIPRSPLAQTMRLHTTVFPILAWVVTRTFSESNSGDFCGVITWLMVSF